MDDVFSCGETAWDLIHDRSYSLLRKKYTPFLEGNPEKICSLYFFLCGVSSTGSWFAFISSLLYYQEIPDIHFLYYLSAYTLGSLPVLALHKSYEQNISKRDFSKWPFVMRMAGLSVYGVIISASYSFFSFSLLVTLLFILGLGISHGALLGGLSQLGSVFPDPCTGALLLGVDMAGIIPVILIIVITMAGGCVVVDCVWGHVLFLTPAIVALAGIVSLILLLRSKMAVQCLGQANAILRHNVEGLETLLSRSSEDNSEDSPTASLASGEQYVSLSSFLSVSDTASPTNYQQALAWGVVVLACTFSTYFMVPFFPAAQKTYVHLPIFLYFAQHFADIVGRELLCVFVKNAVKNKLFMWTLVLLRTLIIIGWLAEVLVQPFSAAVTSVLEVGAVVLCGLVGGAINPAVYMLAGLRISDDSRESVKAIHCCMWCSVAGSLAALLLLNVTAFTPLTIWSF